ncbi:MAG: AAA family ATPase, partial [bacterium]
EEKDTFILTKENINNFVDIVNQIIEDHQSGKYLLKVTDVYECDNKNYHIVYWVDENKLKLPTKNFSIKISISNLYFENEEQLEKEIHSHLINNKHIILTGPPGTGKSKLAKEICNHYVGENEYNMVTASPDWSTFDTIGGYKPDKEDQLQFNPGIFLECFKKDSPDNKWLIIDEINRADIDKAFGPLFSTLTGDTVTLSFKAENNKQIELIPQKNEDEKIIPEEHIYYIPRDWRIIATMNTFDKASLYEMSYAFMRRFAFVPVPIPEELDINDYLDYWDISQKNKKNYKDNLNELWKAINDVRKVGPAIMKDILKFLITYDEKEEKNKRYISAIISYVLPQFEGLRKDKIDDFKDNLKELSFISENDVKERLSSFIKDYFRLEG